MKVSCQFHGGLQLFSGLFSKGDIHSWTGAHDLKVSCQFHVNFRGFAAVLRCLSKNDIHSWTGAHNLNAS